MGDPLDRFEPDGSVFQSVPPMGDPLDRSEPDGSVFQSIPPSNPSGGGGGNGNENGTTDGPSFVAADQRSDPLDRSEPDGSVFQSVQPMGDPLDRFEPDGSVFQSDQQRASPTSPDQLETYGTDASGIWNSPGEAYASASPSELNAAETATEIAGVSFNSAAEPPTGNVVMDTETFTPNETNNEVFNDTGSGGFSNYGGSFYGGGSYGGGFYGGGSYGGGFYGGGSYGGGFYGGGSYGGGFYGGGSYGGGFYGGGSYGGGFYGGGSYGGGFYGGGFYGGGGVDGGGGHGGVHPRIPDLDGNDGIEITPLASSNMFFDIAGDGRQHRTAWAGAGDGVLVLDVGNDGQITQRNEVVFTDWDATATSDMQALAHVFDTNNNGSLDAGDAQFSSFKILVTNADGTTTLKTLAEAGITSINLIPDASRIVLPDGSVIDGQTTFTRSDSTTGKAATVTLTGELAGHILNQSVAHNGDGSTTIDSKALNPDGSVAYEIIGLTSADGNTRTLSFDRNGDGVIDRIQTIATVTNADGSKTETLTNRTGAAVLVDTTVTTTSADGKAITIRRDVTGDGLDDETETRVTAADGSSTITVSELNPDGSLKSRATTTTSANGLTRTVSMDRDGDALNDLTEVDATVVNADGSRTKTVSRTNQDGSLRDRSVTTTSADGRNKTTQTDLNVDTVLDLTYACLIAVLADGSSTSTETTSNTNGSLRAKTVTSLSADGLSRTIQADEIGRAHV